MNDIRNDAVEGCRLSPQQRRLWSLRHSRDDRVFSAQCSVRIGGNLDSTALKAALQRVVRRHEILGTSFHLRPGMKAPLQIIATDGELTLCAADLSGLDSAGQALALDTRWREQLSYAFDLRAPPLVRLLLVKLSKDEHVLLITLPALCADVWTFRNLAREISDAYANDSQGDKTGDEPLQYADYCEWLHDLLESDDEHARAGSAHWQGPALPSPPQVKLPFESAVADGTLLQPDCLSFDLDEASSEQIEATAQSYGASASNVLLACWQITLWRLTRQQIAVHVLCDGRQYDELRDALGLFAKYPPVDCQLAEDLVFSAVLRETERRLNEAREWQDYWEPRAEAAKNAIAFEYEEQPLPHLSGDATFSLARTYCCIDRSKLKLAITKEAGLRAAFFYDPQAFDRDTISRIADSFKVLLQSAIRDPDCAIGELSMLESRERQRLLIDLNQTRTDQIDPQCVHHSFEDQVKRTPNEIALVCGDQRLSYAELNARANRLAHYLRRKGVAPDTCVPLCVERSAEALIGVLGILKAGGAYVPLNPTYPKARLAQQLGDIQPPAIVTQKDLLAALPEFAGEVICLDDDRTINESENDPPPAGTLDHLVYVLYTSGSTGTPKGVAITHRSLSNYTRFICDKLGLAEKRYAFATVSTLSADLGNTCLFPSLASGGCLHVISYDVATDAASFADYVARQPIDVLKIVPSHLKTLLDADAAILPRGYLILGGEALSWKLIERIKNQQATCRVINHYGPTETTVGSLTFDLDNQRSDSATMPIGRPIANTEVYLLDPHLNPVPIGVPGELHIGGAGLARGYLNRPELTAEKFIPNPFSNDPGSRLYKTGDLARYLRDGNIEFLGRIDHQVKIRGFRIELGEIETALGEHRQVRESVVIARELESGDKQLVAYIVARGQPAPAVKELRSFLKERLPDYMAPAAFVMLKALPLNRNGKLDRNALPNPDHARPEVDDTFMAPRSPAEEALGRIWANVLGIEKIGVNDNFFELGGDSILSIQIIARANQAGFGLTLKQLFQHQTIAELAQIAGSTRVAQVDQSLVTGAVLLTPIQKWFFEQRLPEPHHYNQSQLLEVRATMDPLLLEKVIAKLMAHHDALRLRFVETESGWQQSIAPHDDRVPFSEEDLSTLSATEQDSAMAAVAEKLQTSLNLSHGPLLRIALFDLGARGGRLLIVIHHLAVDGVSWRILLEDLQSAYQQLSDGQAIELPSKTLSFKEWAQRLTEHAKSDSVQAERDYWLDIPRAAVPSLPVDFSAVAGDNSVASTRTVCESLDEEETQLLLQRVPEAYRTQINDALLTALVQAAAAWTGSHAFLVDLEGHGREEIFEGIDVSRTVGWFTTRFPVHLDLEEPFDAGNVLQSVKEQLRSIPNKGIGYGMLRYLSGDAELIGKLKALPQPQLSFNFLGQFDQTFAASSSLAWAGESSGATRSPLGIRRHLLTIVGLIVEKRLRLDWKYSENIHKRETVEHLARTMMRALRTLIEHCKSPDAGGYTPSDFPKARLSQKDLDTLMAKVTRSK